MTLNHKLAIMIDDFSISTVPDEGPTSARRRGLCIGIAPRHARALIAIAIVCVMRQPIFAQETVHPEAAQATVVAAMQPNAARAEGPETARSASDSEPSTSPAASPVGSAMATITGTVLDVNGDLVPGAAVVLNGGSSDDQREVTADDGAAFKFDSVKPGIPYELSVHVKGFSAWTSPAIVLTPSQFLILDDIHLKMEGDSTSITVYGSTAE